MSIMTAAVIGTIVYWIIYVLDPYIFSWQCLNRPIVIAPVLGLLLGDFQTGIIMGAALESISRRCAFRNGSIRILYDIDGGGCGDGACDRIAYRNRYGIGQQYVYVSLVGDCALLGEIGSIRKTE